MRTDRDRSWGSCNAWTSTMRLPFKVTRTWTSPYLLLATGPSTVWVPPREIVVVVFVDGLVDFVVGGDAAVVVDVPPAAVAAEVATGVVWKLAKATSAPPVAATTGIARRVAMLSSRIVRSECDVEERAIA
jgi:hypothetical protein